MEGCLEMIRDKYKDYFDKELIIRLYNENNSVIQIAKQLNTKSQYVYRFMNYHDIKRRDKTDSMKIAYEKNI
jgi:hypothetical protein